ncbi:MAG: 50S ribosomal protein L35 [Candidatus Zixiibacteriota bacterium]
MPKIKTRKGLKKRIRISGTGKLMHHKSGKGHFNRRKSESRKRRLRIKGHLKGNNAKRAKKLLGI